MECSSRGDVVRAAMRVVSNAGDGLNGVVASALLGNWLFCDRFRCIFPERGTRVIAVLYQSNRMWYNRPQLQVLGLYFSTA